MRRVTQGRTSAASHQLACMRFHLRATPWLRTHRLRGKEEVVECCDQLIETFLVHGVDPFRVLDQHSEVEKHAGIGGDHRSVDAQGPRRVRLTAGVKCVVMDQLNPQLAAESLSGHVDDEGSWDRDRQTLEHVSIVPVLGLLACQSSCLVCIDNIEMTRQDHYLRRAVLIHRMGWASPRSTHSGTMLSRLRCLTREVIRLRACHAAHGPYPPLLQPFASRVSTLVREAVAERDDAVRSGTPRTHPPARPCRKSAARRACVDARKERAVPLRLPRAAPRDGGAGLRRPRRVGGRSR